MKNALLGLVAVAAISGTAFSQTSTPDSAGSNTSASTQRVDDTPHHDYGWIGLLGLAGLAGLRKQDHTRSVNTTTTGTGR